MNMKCLFGHKWNGCKCERCGEMRNEQHDWNGCKCKRCASTRDEGHVWVFLEGKCKEKCSICGKERNIEHKWDGCICKLCGKARNEQHDLILKSSNKYVITCSKCEYKQISLAALTEAERTCLITHGYAYSKTKAPGVWLENPLNSKQMPCQNFTCAQLGMDMFKDERSAWLPTIPKDKAREIFNSTFLKIAEIDKELREIRYS